MFCRCESAHPTAVCKTPDHRGFMRVAPGVVLLSIPLTSSLYRSRGGILPLSSVKDALTIIFSLSSQLQESYLFGV